MIEVDGRFGEGGGQILRTSVALASALRKDIRVVNIRAGRPRPGIMAQHLAGIRAASEISRASVEGAEVGSSTLLYRPGKVRAGKFQFDIGTAGSITLVLQTLMPILVMVREKVEVALTGGTDVKWSPPIDYLRLVALPILKLMGFEGSLIVSKRGHYPRGGGKVEFHSAPRNGLLPLSVVRKGNPVEIEGVSHASGLPFQVAERQAAAASRLIRGEGLPSPKIALEQAESQATGSVGSGIVLAAKTESGTVLGADNLGEKGKPAEEVGAETAKMLIEEVRSRACLDRHMGDMVVPFMVLAEGTSEASVSRVTQHMLTNVGVAELVAGVRFQDPGGVNSPGVLRVRGLGLNSQPAASSATVLRSFSSP